MQNFKLEENLEKPKYILLSEGITKQIESGQIVLGQKLPSVNRLAEEFSFSRETVFKALAHLSEKGIVKAVDKIGYFVSDTSPETDFRVFFMLDRFTAFKEDLYNAFVATLGEKAKISLYFHHQNIELFESLILQNFKNYTHFVITTFLEESDTLYNALDKIPPEKLIILDKYEQNLAKGYGAIYQDFENDILEALSNNFVLVKRYRRIIFILNENDQQGHYLKSGFLKFCKTNNLKGEVQNGFIMGQFKRGNLYITVDPHDRDLVEIIKQVQLKKWKLGKEIGIISYNDTPLKEILTGGITVISTNFVKMGEEAANMILNRNHFQKQNKTEIILRSSL